MELRKTFNNIISSFLMIAVFFGPSAHCLANEIPSINTSRVAFKACDYDGICQLLDLIETGELDRRLTQQQIQEVNEFIGTLAIKGGNSSDVLEMQELEEDVYALVHSDSPSFQYAYMDGRIQFIPAVFTGKQDLVLCGFGKGWEKTKQFVKKHKKAIIIGAVVATVIVTAAVIITMSGGTATPATQALVSGGASIIGALDGNTSTKGNIQPLDPVLDQKIEAFKDEVYRNDLLTSFDPNFPKEESGKAVALAFSRNLLEDHLKGLNNTGNIYQSIEDKFSANPWLKTSYSEDPLANFHYIRGEKALELGYYHQAVSDFSDTIKLQPNNDLLYLDRANAFYHVNDYPRALEDLDHYKSKSSLKKGALPINIYEFARGAKDGLKESGQELILFASDIVLHPVHTVTELHYAIENLASLVGTGEFETIAQGLSPQLYELITEWHFLDIDRRSYLCGYVPFKHAADIVIPGGSIKLAKEVAILYKLEKATQNAIRLELGLARQAYYSSVFPLVETLPNAKKPLEVVDNFKKTRVIDFKPTSADPVKRIKEAEHFLKTFSKTFRPEEEVRALIHSTGIQTFPRPVGVPESFKVQISERGAGMKYVHPEHTHTSIRVMPGKPHSPFPFQQKPYIIHRKNGRTLDKLGNEVLRDAPEAHIPIEEFVFKGD